MSSKVGGFFLGFILEEFCPFYHVVRMAAAINPPTQTSVTQTPTLSNCSTSGTLIIQ